MANEQVVRRLTLIADAQGVDKATASVAGLKNESAALATVTDTSAKRALSAEAAYKKLASQIDDTARATSAIERGTRTLDAALAQGIITQDKYNESLSQLNDKYKDTGDANTKLSDGFKITGVEAASVANHLVKLTGLAYALSPAFRAFADPAIAAGMRASGVALGAMSPLAATLAVTLAQRVLPLIARVAAFALPFALLRAEIDLIGYAWTSAQERIAKYIAISNDATAAGVSTDYWQRWGEAGKIAGLGIDKATAALKAFGDASKEQLGGSSLEQQLKKHLEVGNVTAKQLKPFEMAAGTEEKMAAMAKILDQMVASGKTLAAVDLVKTFAGPEMAEQFRQNTNIFNELVSKAKEVAATKLVSQADLDDAVQLNKRYDDAVKILSERWIPFQKAITDGGQELYRVWVNILEVLAGALTSISNFAIKIGEIIQSIPGLVTGLKLAGSAAANMIPGVAPLRLAIGAVSGLAGGSAESGSSRAGYSDLANRMSNPNNVKAATSRTLDLSNALRSDKSLSLDKKQIDDTTDAVDRAINSITKHIEQVKANTLAVGQNVGVQARLKVEAAETAAKMANGGEMTAQQAAQFAKLKVEAESAAMALEKAQIANDIKRQRDSLFLTAEDVQIANQLKGLYADIPTALQSAEAQQIRFNNAMKNMVDTVRDAASSFTKDFLGGLMKGKGLMESLQGAAKNLSSSLLNSGVNDLFSGNFVSAGLKIGGSFLASLFGDDDEEEKAAQKKAQEEAARKAEAAQNRKNDFTYQYQLSQIDTGTIAGQIQAFDIQANKQRADEMKAGGEAILELEKKLAADRQAIVDKANAAVLKSYRDFLDSVKTGDLSTLSPEDQLKYAQTRFDSDVSAAKNGDQDAIERVTKDAQSLLEIAKSFYASSTGYTSIYDAVTKTIQGLASASQYTAPADTNIITTAPSNNDRFAGFRGSGVLANVADEVVQAQLVPGYASGGIVSNGMRGVDSVMAKLAGGEFVTKTPSVNSSTLGALRHINNTGTAPRGDNSEVVRVLAQGFNGQTAVLADKLDAVADRIKRLEDMTRQVSNQRRVPGSN